MSYTPSNPWQPLEGELFLQHTDGRVQRVLHHRSTFCGYWVEPRASLSRDGRFAAFASDWMYGSSSDGCRDDEMGRGDPYVVEMPRAP